MMLAIIGAMVIMTNSNQEEVWSVSEETVQTVTNVVETLGERIVHSFIQLVNDNGEVQYQMEPDGTKTVTTTVKRIYTITVTYHGRKHKLAYEEILSVDVKKYVKRETWEEAGQTERETRR